MHLYSVKVKSYFQESFVAKLWIPSKFLKRMVNAENNELGLRFSHFAEMWKLKVTRRFPFNSSSRIYHFKREKKTPKPIIEEFLFKNPQTNSNNDKKQQKSTPHQTNKKKQPWTFSQTKRNTEFWNYFILKRETKLTICFPCWKHEFCFIPSNDEMQSCFPVLFQFIIK